MSLQTLRLLSQKSLLTRMAILVAAILIAVIVSLPVGYAILPTEMSLAASIVAGGICLFSGCIALGVSESFRRPQQVLALVALGTMTRLGIVLTAGTLIYLRGGPLVSAGVIYYLIAFYQVTLTVEIILILPSGRYFRKPIPEQGDRRV
jgi:hypothetical protein